MASNKKKVVVVCPGRGSYTQESLGYLKKNAAVVSSEIKEWDQQMKNSGRPSLSELDGAKVFSPKLHMVGEHASPLIYACAYSDFLQINPDKYEVVAAVGNSMGWYITLSVAQVLEQQKAFHLIDTMGSMMKDKLIGGQIIYTLVNENWLINLEREAILKQAIQEVGHQVGPVYVSIHLGGQVVLAGEDRVLQELMSRLPKVENFPFKLVGHGAFHTPLLESISERAFEQIDLKNFKKPKFPIIDGQGKIWGPKSADVVDLYEYTLGDQVVATYDFTLSVEVALKEFAPDHLILLGPGSNLGGALGQILIKNKWENIYTKKDFVDRQKTNPYLLAMGMNDQRALVI